MELEEFIVEELLNRISDDESLGPAFMSCFGGTTSSSGDSPTGCVSISVNSLPATGLYQPGMYTSTPLYLSTYQYRVSLVVGMHLLENTSNLLAARAGSTNDPLAVGMHQSGANTSDPLAGDEH